AGQPIAFSANVKDANNNWVSGIRVVWDQELLMCSGRQLLETKATDQFGYVNYDRKGGAWGTYKVAAYLENNPAIRSRDYSVTVTM
ncbi:MAG: hypothetical protein ACRC68_02805, partial [Clostridium sp.]